MDIRKEDIASVIVTFILLFIWFVTLLVFNYPLFSVSILWVGMIVLSVIYVMVYYRNKRDMHIFKIRFLVSAVPIYPALAFYVYILITGQEVAGYFRLLPLGIIGTMLFLNLVVVYYFSQRLSAS
ncbi:MAG: hypothetical protein JW840_08130 [Candidatus Thermoplasmatota archaeon]|nr:hypothetical protein [Candidatus Thermoplasmatota archaeon]